MRILPTLLTGLLLSGTVLATSGPKLALAWEANPRSFDPRFANDANSQYLMDLTHCSLIRFDREANVSAGLASSWEWKNPTTLVLNLKKDVRFNDGSPLNADDVAATYRFLVEAKSTPPSPLMGAFQVVKNIIVNSPEQIQFELKSPDVSFLDNLFIGILPKDLASKPMLTQVKDIKGCGPFVLSKVGINDLVLTRNEYYALGSLPKLQEITVKIVRDDTTRFSKLIKGELDLVQNGVSRDQLKRLEKSHASLTFKSQPGLNVSYLGFNFRDHILSKPEVRNAISLAINRKQIIEHLLQGMAEPANSFLTPGNPFRIEQAPLVFDLAKAQALLDKVGLPLKDDGKGHKHRFSLTLKTTADQTRSNVAHAIAGQLQALGVKVTVETLEWGKFKADVDKGAVQMWLLNWIGYKDPDIFRYALATESFPPNGGNRGWYSNAKLDAILSEARKTTDLSKRKNLYAQAQTIVNEDVPYAFLWHDKNFVVLNKAIKGYEIFADGRFSSLVDVTK